jgi:peptidoglycan/LPS O-acetylase OafA/YrhL|tara:strand:- start:443 stop:1609 length:1167 start_codon:yes stop_codon:yes gene_type:complete
LLLTEYDLTYRPEIDGLRAVAVVLVLLFHAAFTVMGRSDWFKNGYIGVDIFFVISGYLITLIILKELRETGGFSFGNFYERRARRILPVLFFIIFATFPVAFHLLSDAELYEFLLSVISIIFFVSNIFFYFVYDAGTPTIAPFVHTWSLAVEEQFYLIFPIALLLLRRHIPKFTLPIFFIVFCLSFFFAEYIGRYDYEFNYSQLPSRIWELLAGSFLAFMELERGKVRRNRFNSLLPIAGAAMIFWYVMLLGTDPVHPGYLSIFPILGTMLIIAFASGDDLVGRALSLKPVVATGKMSYSLYLWHLPVYMFLEYAYPNSKNPEKLGWVILTFLLSVISYYLIERPFRNREVIRAKPFFYLIGTTAILIVFLSFPGDRFSIVGSGLAGH